MHEPGARPFPNPVIAPPIACIDVPPGHVASVVTSLEMTARPPRPSKPARGDLSLHRADAPDPEWYRALFRRLGENWLWFSRLQLPIPALRELLHDPAREIYVLRAGMEEAGLAELDFRVPETCELSFFGIAAEHIGTGAGRYLMTCALDIVWSRPVTRLWVHTCTHDHPLALGFYIRSGFQPFRCHVEMFEDPRLTGVLSREACPHVPIIADG